MHTVRALANVNTEHKSAGSAQFYILTKKRELHHIHKFSTSGHDFHS
jgi:hypothetical protein